VAIGAPLANSCDFRSPLISCGQIYLIDVTTIGPGVENISIVGAPSSNCYSTGTASQTNKFSYNGPLTPRVGMMFGGSVALDSQSSLLTAAAPGSGEVYSLSFLRRLLANIPVGVVVSNTFPLFQTSSNVIAGTLSACSLAQIFPLQLQSTANVTLATVSLESNVTIQLGALVSIGNLTIDPLATTLVVVVPPNEGVGNFSVVLVSYGSESGSFGSLQLQLSDPCSVVVGTPELVYSSSSLSVTYSLAQVPSCTSNSNATLYTGLSAGQIAGIAVGATAGGVLVALAVVLVTKAVIAHQTNTANSALRSNGLEELNRYKTDQL
jgi:hypothetical protein